MSEAPNSWAILLQVLEYIFRILVVIVIPATVWLIREIFKLKKNQALTDKDVCHMRDNFNEKFAAAPGGKEVSELANAITGLNGQVAGMRQILDKLDRTVTRHEDFLLQGGRR